MAGLGRAQDGSSLVEFAILAPILALLFVGMVDIGRGAYYGILAANAARAGAQYGAINTTTANDVAGMQTAAKQDAPNLSWTVNATPLCSVNGGTPAVCNTSGSGPLTNTIYYVKVQVTASFPTLIKYPGIPSQIPVSGSEEMRVVNQ
ncbi:MAG TPA: TadE/TadG family type IV pilus assembly protein [Candidatus Nitrosotalea sp.]|nr:TadE/TadG family type IV pilus assembly protein [Candidatus Nitrosotalea sp.]